MPDSAKNSAREQSSPSAAPARLAEICHWMKTDRLAAAELELFTWMREQGCPPAARLLAAASLARRGNTRDAREILRKAQPFEHDADTREMKLLIALLVDLDITNAIAPLLRMLHDQHSYDPQVARWIDIMDLPGTDDLRAVPDCNVELLAAELLTDLGVIPSLIKAQTHQPDVRSVLLLRSAIRRLERHVHSDEDRLIICHAMAELSIISHDQDSARRWAHRGLKINPYNAQLALIVAALPDDAAMDTDATAVLKTIADRHPNYPDIRAALIRREHATGLTDDARMHLAQWIDQQPDHPIALELTREIAA